MNMPRVRTTPTTNEYYHIYNRGVDKRSIFGNVYDLRRFLLSMQLFNTIEPIGSLHEHIRLHESMLQKRKPHFNPEHESLDDAPLIHIIAYNILPNHYHLIVRQCIDNGISEFQKRLGSGYTLYFNEKNDRSGSLFEGGYKLVHIDSDEYFRYVFAYVSCNESVHDMHFSFPIPNKDQLTLSNRHQYEKSGVGLCHTQDAQEYILNQKFWTEAPQLASEIKKRRAMSALIIE